MLLCWGVSCRFLAGFWFLVPVPKPCRLPRLLGRVALVKEKGREGEVAVGLARCLFALLRCLLSVSIGKSDQQSNNTTVPACHQMHPLPGATSLTTPIQSALHFCTALSHQLGPLPPREPSPQPPAPNQPSPLRIPWPPPVAPARFSSSALAGRLHVCLALQKHPRKRCMH